MRYTWRVDIRISRQVLDEMLAEARAAGARECCGLLFGRDNGVHAIGPAANVAPDPNRHFEIDPAVLLAAQKAQRAGGPQVIGYYHSHPNGSAQPSAEDAILAAADGRIWIIIADEAISGWRAGGTGTLHGRFEPVAIRIA